MSFNFTVREFILGGGNTTPTLQFYRKGFNLGGDASPSWRDVILSGNTSLTLVNAKEDGLNYLKLFGGAEQLPEQYLDTVILSGGCEQSGTPTPDTPMDIWCNNGVVKVSPNVAVLSSNTMSSPITNIDITTGTFNVSVSKSNTSSQITSSLATLCPNLKEGDTVYFHFNSEPTGNMYLGGYGNGIQINSDSSLTITSTHLSTQLRFGGGDSSIVRTFAITNFYIGKEPYSSFSSYPAYGDIYTDGTQEVVTDSVGNTATAEMLLKVGTYQDVQEVLAGDVTRNVGIKVLDGTENIYDGTSGYWGIASSYFPNIKMKISGAILATSWGEGDYLSSRGAYCSIAGTSYFAFNKASLPNASTAEAVKQWLANQYNAGHPVIVVYPLATPTTESVTAQPLSIQAGTNIITAEGSIDNLGLEVSYKGKI